MMRLDCFNQEVLRTLQCIHIVGGSILTKLDSWSKLADITYFAYLLLHVR